MRVRSVLRGVLLAFVLAAAGLGGFVWWNLHDRSPGSEFSVVVRPTPSVPARLRVGFGRRTINPDMTKTVWVAGFAHNRAATRIHDDLKAVAAVIDDGEHRIGLVALDAIGFFHDEVLAVRRNLPSSARLDYVVVASTHNHSAPDLMGIWGPSELRSGIDPEYRAAVVAGAAGALLDAVEALTPSSVSFVEVPLDPAGLVADSRDPQVFDATLRLMHFTRADGSTVGTIVNWANHPETPWAANTELTADFPGYLRDALEAGVTVDGRQVEAGLGGMHVYVNGAIGGLMTTNPQTTVVDPYTQQPFTEPSHDKARALGRRLAQAALAAVRAGGGVAQKRAADRLCRTHPGIAHRQHAVPSRQRAGALRARAAAAEPHPHRGVGAHLRRCERHLCARRALSGDCQRRHRAPAGRRLRCRPGGGPAAAGADARADQVPGGARQRRGRLHHSEIGVGRCRAVALRRAAAALRRDQLARPRDRSGNPPGGAGFVGRTDGATRRAHSERRRG